MGDPDPGWAPRVFLSYASEDAFWVSIFRKPLWFANHLGNVIIEDFIAGENVGFGRLEPWIDERVSFASVVLVFLSRHYIEKEWTVVEWEKTLRKLGRLIFVPVIMDAAGKQWWGLSKAQGQLKELPLDYQFADFSSGGLPVVIKETDSEVVGKINALALKIRDLLKAPVGPPAPPNSAQSPRVVLLAHPTSRMPNDIVTDMKSLGEALRAGGVTVETWSDGWADEAARVSSDEALSAPEMFIRPLMEQEAASHADNDGQTQKQIKDTGAASAPVTLWLPSPRTDRRFSKAAAERATDLRPAMRLDRPAELATWLRNLLVPPQTATPDLVLQIEDVGADGDALPDIGAREIADKLREFICAVVGGVVRPEPDPWPFFGSQFSKQIALLPGGKAIVVLHDLNICPTAEPGSARRMIEQKFQDTHDQLEAFFSRNPKPLNLFKTALIARNADVMPFSAYPSNGRWKDWRLLCFEEVDDTAADAVGAASIRPDPASLAAYRLYLHQWASTP